MSKEELLARLQEIKDTGKTVQGHKDADDALIEYINDREIALAYAHIPKWFA